MCIIYFLVIRIGYSDPDREEQVGKMYSANIKILIIPSVRVLYFKSGFNSQHTLISAIKILKPHSR